MSLVFSTSSIASPSYSTRFTIYNFKPKTNASLCSYFFFSRYKAATSFKSIKCVKADSYQSFTEEKVPLSDWEDDREKQDDEEEMDSPWKGAVIYKRNPSITHLEYCTTLESLGLGHLSTKVSKSRASIMGLRVTKSVKDYPLGTPVQVSFDVTKKKKQRLRLDGIIKTVLTLDCNRCGGPAAESVFSNISILLSEEPIKEPEVIDMGLIFGSDKGKEGSGNTDEEEDDDSMIDWEDQLYFPPEEKEIDISKNIRDMVHLEITINAVCDPKCKGLCLKCGTNLNSSACSCSSEKVGKKEYGPLGNLKNKMQSKK